MIGLSKVSIDCGAFHLTDLNLKIEAGQYAVLMGKTGAGKTSILEAICGLRPVRAGTIQLNGRDVTAIPPAKRQIGYVPQDLGLFTMMTVRNNLLFAPRLQRRSQEWMEAKLADLSRLLSLSHLLDRSVLRLSGGEAQRVALGRALAFEPPWLLLDEPLSALDEATREEIHEVLRLVRQETQVTILHVTHNTNEAHALATNIFHLVEGRLEQETSSILDG
jgi:ABC-type sugar transport system ATPase subunit